MFKRMFGGQKTVRPQWYDEGWKLFDLGMELALVFGAPRLREAKVRRLNRFGW